MIFAFTPASVGLLLALGGTPPPSGSAQTSTATAAAETRAVETARLVEQARTHFDAGNEHYAAGRFHEAIRHFQAGYALVPRPNFLVNLGQAFRQVGDLARAKEAYVSYVRALPEKSALRDQALQVLAEIEVQIHERQPATAAGGPSPLRDSPELAVAPPLAPLPPPAADGGGNARWIAVGVGAAGLALAGAGLAFELRAKSASDDLTALAERGLLFDPARERAGERDERIGIGLLAAGGAALAAGVLVFVLLDRGTGGGERAARAVKLARLSRQPGMALGLRF